jgi:hypothetical protein
MRAPALLVLLFIASCHDASPEARSTPAPETPADSGPTTVPDSGPSVKEVLRQRAEEEVERATLPDSGSFPTASRCQIPPMTFSWPTVVARVERIVERDNRLNQQIRSSKELEQAWQRVELRVLRVLNAEALDQARLAQAARASAWDRQFLRELQPHWTVIGV